MSLQLFTWEAMPEGTRYGEDPSRLVRLHRGMSRSDLNEGAFPIQSRAFQFGPRSVIDAVTEAVNQGQGKKLASYTSQQTLDGHAKFANINTPFISARPGTPEDVYFHASDHPDGIAVEFEVPANSIIVPWLIDNTPGKEPNEVLLVGAIPAEAIMAIRDPKIEALPEVPEEQLVRIL